MFKIELLVEAKTLGSALLALDGLIVGEPVIRPVKGAVVQKTTTKAQGPKTKVVAAKDNTTGTMLGNLAAAVLNTPADKITSREIRDLATRMKLSSHVTETATYQLRLKGILSSALEGTKRGSHLRTYLILRPQSNNSAGAPQETSQHG